MYNNENPLKGSYKRNHERDYHCTEEEVKAMFIDASDSGIDGSLLEGFTMEDVDLNTQAYTYNLLGVLLSKSQCDHSHHNIPHYHLIKYLH